MPSGGSIIEITCSHPNLGNYTFFAVQDEDSTYEPGGIQTSEDVAMSGNGDAVYKQSIIPATFMVPITWDMGSNDSLTQVSKYQADPLPGTWSFTNINGTVHKLTGKPAGVVSANGNTSRMDLKIFGNNFRML